MRTIASVAAILCVVIGIALAGGHSTTIKSTYDFGLTGNDWWAAQQHTTSKAASASAEHR